MVWSDAELKQKTKQLLPEWGKYVDDIDFDQRAIDVRVIESGLVDKVSGQYRLDMAFTNACLIGELKGFNSDWAFMGGELFCEGCSEIDYEIRGHDVSFREFLEKVINHIEGVHMDWVKAHE